jgi:uncharacterized protein YigE (DUF2233 family)
MRLARTDSKWQAANPDKMPAFKDGSQVLVAVPVQWCSTAEEGYEYSVVTVERNGNRVWLYCGGALWGWTWKEVEHWKQLK